MEQINLFEMDEGREYTFNKKIDIVKAEFIEADSLNWQELFEGYSELYGITYSSGIQFMTKVLENFEKAEVIFGCEDIVSGSVATIMAAQRAIVEKIGKSKSADKMSKMMEEGRLDLFVSRDVKSHEKVFILKSNDGRTRVITGSANFSASAFCGIQRENILAFDDAKAFEWYKEKYEDFKLHCSDNVNLKTVKGAIAEEEYFQENIEEIPIIQTIRKKNIVILEESNWENEKDVEIVADIKGLEEEIKPLIPKQKGDGGKIVLAGNFISGFKRKYKEQRDIKRIKEKQLPKLTIDYDLCQLYFNGKEMNLSPEKQQVTSDINCFESYMSSMENFHGNVKRNQREYFSFLNWYFASPFMPYLRLVASKNNYDLTPFPVVGIIYGDSNGGKSTFVRLLTKMMCGMKIPMNTSNDFTAGNIENLKCACEGLPINIDDLAKQQYQTHFEKIIKDDEWGLKEGFVNYPAIAISTNKLAALSADISKRAITCLITARIDKETGAKSSKKINESMHKMTTAFYCEYARRMIDKVVEMGEKMKAEGDDFFPDIFEISSKIIVDIFEEFNDSKGGFPEYISTLTYADYFGDKVVGRNAINKIFVAWKNERKQFKIDKKNNKLIYAYPEGGRTYELRYIFDELPPSLNASLTARTIVMDLDKAREFFEIDFKGKGWF